MFKLLLPSSVLAFSTMLAGPATQVPTPPAFKTYAQFNDTLVAQFRALAKNVDV